MTPVTLDIAVAFVIDVAFVITVFRESWDFFRLRPWILITGFVLWPLRSIIFGSTKIYLVERGGGLVVDFACILLVS